MMSRSTLLLLAGSLTFFFGCQSYSNEQIEAITHDFLEALKAEDKATARTLYPSAIMWNHLWTVDQTEIIEIRPVANRIAVSFRNRYSENFQRYTKVAVLYFEQTQLDGQDYFIISDSRGLFDFAASPHFEFAQKTGCLSLASDLSDQQIQSALNQAYDLFGLSMISLSREAKAKLKVLDWKWKQNPYLGIIGTGVAQNNFNLPISNVECIVTYFDLKDSLINTTHKHIRFKDLRPGTTEAFTIVSEGTIYPARAKVHFKFDTNSLVKMANEWEYSGTECENGFEAFLKRQ